MLIRGTHSKLVEVSLPQDWHACCTHLASYGTVIGAHPSFKHARSSGGGLSLCDDQVFNSDGYTSERGQLLTCRTVSINSLRGFQGFLTVDVQESVQTTFTVSAVLAEWGAIGCFNAIYMRPGKLNGRNLTGCKFLSGFSRSEHNKFVHVFPLVFVENCGHAEFAILRIGGT